MFYDGIFLPSQTLRNGHYYKLDVDFTDDCGIAAPLSPLELKLQFENILRLSDGNDAPLPVAALTSQKRDIWAKVSPVWPQFRIYRKYVNDAAFQHREELSAQNAEALQLMDKCMFVLSLDEYKPCDSPDASKRTLVGDATNRWFDKCVNLVGFGNGWHGINTEHTALDAMVRKFKTPILVKPFCKALIFNL